MPTHHRLLSNIKAFIIRAAYLDPEMTHVIASFLAIGWGMWLLLPGDSFGHSPTYATMATLAREEVWGSIFVVLGSLKLYALINYFPKLLATAGALAAGMWAFVAVVFTMANPTSTATPIYTCICLASTWAALATKTQEVD